jgi:hypothetical protein
MHRLQGLLLTEKLPQLSHDGLISVSAMLLQTLFHTSVKRAVAHRLPSASYKPGTPASTRLLSLILRPITTELRLVVWVVVLLMAELLLDILVSRQLPLIVSTL